MYNFLFFFKSIFKRKNLLVDCESLIYDGRSSTKIEGKRKRKYTQIWTGFFP